jgi:hypothetical protein
LWIRPWAQGEAHFPVWKEKQFCFVLEEVDEFEFEYEVALLELDFGLP